MANQDSREINFLEEDKNVGYQFKSSVNYQQNFSLPTQQQWITNVDDEENFKILDPDDPLMKRFQDALKSHLNRIDNKLSEEISELEAAIKDAKKTRENEGVILYDIQQEAARQETAIETYKDMLAEVTHLRGDVQERLIKVKEKHKNVSAELQDKRVKEKKLTHSVESLNTLQQQFSKWENELSGNLTISQRISEKDAALERELLNQKQQKDFVLYKLEDEVWKLQSEIKDLDEQLQIKDQEKVNLSQTIADANADLECLEREHKTLYSAWNNVLNLISQRDKINEEITSEQRKIQETLLNLQTQIEKLKTDSSKEMENNERLTGLQTRINDEIKLMKKLYDSDKETYLNLETNFVKVSKLVEQNEREYAGVMAAYESTVNNEKSMDKELTRSENQRRDLEEQILTKLDDKITSDKEVRFMNKLLHEAKDQSLESELTLTRSENTYGKSLLEIEKLNSLIENEKFDLDAIEQKNAEKQKEINNLQGEIKDYNVLFKQKERKVEILNKRIEEILETTGRQEANPLDMKIIAIEKSLEDTEAKIKKSQQIWLRQQGYVFDLSKKRHLQMQELSIISREIMIMEQKNMKLEIDLEKQEKEKANINKIMNALQQKLTQISLRLASQRELKNELEDKNNVTKMEYIKSLKESEMELLKLQADIKQLNNEKATLREEFKSSQQESLSWEKKVQLAIETNKSYKEERNSGGDIATMKSEIHKMDIRLSHLRKAQEKLVQDMEFCISRRDTIVDDAMSKEKRNPKNQHNQRIVLKKRLDDQKTRIKQIIKETKYLENKISTVETEQRKLLQYLNEGQKLMRQNEDFIPDLDKQIMEGEMIKHHNLEVLVRKQRKVNMLQDLKCGRYKPLLKNEVSLSEEFKNQQDMNNDLKDIMQRTEHDFPLLKNQVRKISLTLKIL